jgi:radical SAM family uncharacterized protein
MLDLAERISNELLPRVGQPAQYVGREINARNADVRGADVSVVMAFPDAYTIGISHLGSQILYQMLNDIPGVACDRAYCPLPDAEALMRQFHLPLFGWESRAAVADFDVVGFSLGYELCLTNVLTMLDLAGIPLAAADRHESCPIIIAGDTLADTPQAMAQFIDLFLVGDGETPLTQFVQLLRKAKAAGATREEILLAAAKTITGAYAPRFYREVFNPAGGTTLAAVEPIRPDVPAVIEHARLASLSDSPPLAAPLSPLVEGVHDRVVIEVMRGCPNGCRFCQAGHLRLPVRCRGVDEIMDAARAAIDATGYREISLLSLSTSDYPHLEELLTRLTEEFTPRNVSISLPSLRVDSLLQHLPRLTSEVRKSGLTIAAEGGSERIRRAIGKGITEEDMVSGVRAAFAAGWKSVKVYFMAGFPGETDADIEDIFHLCRRLSDTRREVDGQRGAISASVSWLVPKPHTPMQWCAMGSSERFFEIRNILRDMSRRTCVSFKFHRIERSILETVIVRGDSRVGRVIERAWRAGARLDAWNEHWDWEKWRAALEAESVSPEDYAHKTLPLDARLPWSHIAGPRSDGFLRNQYERMMAVLEKEEEKEEGKGD